MVEFIGEYAWYFMLAAGALGLMWAFRKKAGLFMLIPELISDIFD